MESFSYYAPTKVYFGRGEENHVGSYLRRLSASRVLLHYGGQSAERSGLLHRVRKSLKEAGLSVTELGGVHPNPALSLVREGIALGRREKVDFVLAVGGGSVIDSSKAIAHGIANPELDPWEIQTRRVSPEKSLKKGAILTLSAAGSEMSNSCVITNEDSGEKRGFNADINRLDLAIENPELTFTVDAFQTGCGAVDISMHTMERYFGKGEPQPLTDAIAEAVMRENNRAGKLCIEEPENYEARATMMWASSLAHNDLTSCGRSFLMQVHQLEHEISGMYPRIAHGAGLSALWASWARYTYRAKPSRFATFARTVWEIREEGRTEEETALAGILAQENYYRSIHMPTSLRELELRPEDLPVLAENCSFHGRRVLDGAFVLRADDILMIYQMAMEA